MIEHAINANEAVHFHFKVSVDIFIKDDTFKTYIQENVKGKSKDVLDEVFIFFRRWIQYLQY